MKTRKKLRFPIQAKAIVLIVVLAAVIVEIAVAFYALTSSQKNLADSETTAVNLSNTVAATINGAKVESFATEKVKPIVHDPNTKIVTVDDWESEEWYAYKDKFSALYEEQDYKDLLAFVREIEDVNSKRANNVSCIYITYVDTIGEDSYTIYLADSATVNQYPIGAADTLLERNYDLLTKPEVGYPPFQFYSDIDGWLVTAGAPIYNGENHIVGYAMVDISMATVRANQAQDIIKLFLYLAASMVFVAVVGILVVHFVFVKPVRKLTSVSSSYNKHDVDSTHYQFVNLEIKTHDEISDLAEALKTMEGDVYRQITELTEINKELFESQNQTRKMTVLARTDGLTGVQNKTAYLAEIEKIDGQIKAKKMMPFAIAMIDLNYLKSTNDEFGHDAGDEALIKLSSIICEIFKHSPVYRIGGDEFVVILRKGDFDAKDELIQMFNDEVERCVNELTNEAISAAIGYAVYEPENDTCADDVFKRADKAMYERKRRMKEAK